MRKMLVLLCILSLVALLLVTVSGCGEKEEPKGPSAFTIFLAIWLWVASAVFTGILSVEKNKNIPLWCVLGVLFGPIALIAVGFSQKESE